MTTTPFVMSIETSEGHAYQHGFHLGTIETTARSIVEETFVNRVKEGMPTVTIALMRNGKVFDTFYGDYWQSAVDADPGSWANCQRYWSQSIFGE